MIKKEIGSILYAPADKLIIVSEVVKTLSKIKRVKSYCDGLPYYDIKVFREKIKYYELSRDGVMTHEFLTRDELNEYTNHLLVNRSNLYKEFNPII